MTYKPVILGVVAALAMVGGQANAAPCPTTPDSLSSFEHLLGHSGGSCTISNKMFDAFSFPDTATNDRISFGTNGLVDFVSLAAPTDHGALRNRAGMDFTITSLGDETITKATIGSHGPEGVAGTLRATMSGAGQSHTVSVDHNGTMEILKPPFSARSVVVSDQIATITAGTLNSFTDTFTQSPPTPSGVPEPMSLSIFGLGLAGLALARGRRS